MSDVITEAPAAEADLEAIVPIAGEAFDIGGDAPVRVVVKRLKTIEFLSLMRAVTRGVGPGLSSLNFSDDEDEMAGELVGLLVMALPEAGDDVLAFLQTIVEPTGSAKRDVARFAEVMANPELDDTLRIIEQLVTQEIDDLQVLTGKAQSMWSRLQKMYQKRQSGG